MLDVMVNEMLPRMESQGFELDALEDIFRQKERDLEQGILNFTSRDKNCDAVLRTKEEEDRMLTEMHFTSSIIHVKVSHVNSCDEADICDVNLSPRSPTLLTPPLPSLVFLRSKYHRSQMEELFVSGVEAERQQVEVKTFGIEVAHSLADRRATYNRKLRSRDEEETNFIQNYVEMAKGLQLPLADAIQNQESKITERRATLWRRCAAMAEILAKEEAERLVWKKSFCTAAHTVFGNGGFY